jgi:hypothetical protein
MFRKKMLKSLFWHCALPMLIGLAVYIFFHKPNLVIHQWIFNYCPIPNYYVLINKFSIAEFLLNHLPDCLWAYSLTYFLALFISNSFTRLVKAALIIIIVSFTEIIQLFFLNQFTFDWVDLFLSILISCFTLIFWSYEKENTI